MIETDKLSKTFKTLTAVNAVSLQIEEKELFGLLGPNGAGKSTFIKMLTTLMPSTSGDAKINGRNVTKNQSDIRRTIGYVPQLISADGGLTGAENLWLSAKLYGIPSTILQSRIEEAIELMGLREAANRLVRTYSGGMIRRLEIAQAILHRPKVLFLDEPTVGLDPIARRSVWELITTLREQYSITILITTHLMDEAEILCDRVAIMNRGHIVKVGSPAALIDEVSALKQSTVPEKKLTLEDVFVHFTGNVLVDEAGDLRATSRTRRTASRLG